MQDYFTNSVRVCKFYVDVDEKSVSEIISALGYTVESNCAIKYTNSFITKLQFEIMIHSAFVSVKIIYQTTDTINDVVCALYDNFSTAVPLLREEAMQDDIFNLIVLVAEDDEWRETYEPTDNMYAMYYYIKTQPTTEIYRLLNEAISMQILFIEADKNTIESRRNALNICRFSDDLSRNIAFASILLHGMDSEFYYCRWMCLVELINLNPNILIYIDLTAELNKIRQSTNYEMEILKKATAAY